MILFLPMLQTSLLWWVKVRSRHRYSVGKWIGQFVPGIAILSVTSIRNNHLYWVFLLIRQFNVHRFITLIYRVSDYQTFKPVYLTTSHHIHSPCGTNRHEMLHVVKRYDASGYDPREMMHVSWVARRLCSPRPATDVRSTWTFLLTKFCLAFFSHSFTSKNMRCARQQVFLKFLQTRPDRIRWWVCLQTINSPFVGSGWDHVVELYRDHGFFFFFFWRAGCFRRRKIMREGRGSLQVFQRLERREIRIKLALLSRVHIISGKFLVGNSR